VVHRRTLKEDEAFAALEIREIDHERVPGIDRKTVNEAFVETVDVMNPSRHIV
jgi:hypothetical protein